MKNLLVVLCIFSSFAFLTSCGGDDPIPVVTINGPANGTVYSTIDTLDVFATVVHDIDIVSLTTLIEPIFFTGALDVNQLDDKQDISFTARIPINIEPGMYTFILTATDNEGNSGTDSFNYAVE